MKNKEDFQDILKNDPFGLLVDDRTKKALTSEDRTLISSFEEIVSFVEEYGKEPQSNIDDIIEFRLFSRLKSIKSDPKKIKILKQYDFLGLLSGENLKELSLEDIVSNDPYGLLQDDGLDQDIFKLDHVRASERIMPTYLSRRRACKNFDEYREMFSSLHQELDNRSRRLVNYKSSDLSENRFYCLSGVLLFLQSINGDVKKNNFSSGDRERFDGRTLCIFDNGTESDMLYRSLDKALQVDGYSISELIQHHQFDESIEEHDVFNGFIYILRSHSHNVKHIENLYKIGYTSGTVADRLKNAKNESTYLFDDVEIVATFKCLNLPSYNLEQTIHEFFSSVKLDIELLDRQHNVYRPKEWFQVPLSCIEDAIVLIIDRTINQYMYDTKIKKVVKKELSD